MNNNKEIQLIGVTCTYNEAEMIPYVMPYVERMGYDKFIVYDNESTDNTVELLKQYPFVEVRNFSSNGVFSDSIRTKKILEVLQEYHKMSLKDDNLICFTITDFDEVLFLTAPHTLPFKPWVLNRYLFGKENYFQDTMINILPPKRNINDDFYKDDKYVHLHNNMKCNYWTVYGDKTTVLILNDFLTIEITEGFHRMFLKPKKGVKPKNLKNTNELFGFHLKYINKNIIERKHNNVKDRLYHANYAYVSNIEDIYDSLYTTAFPLHNFFEKIQLVRDVDKCKYSGVFDFDNQERIN
jgi:hypothetical protein